MKILKSFYKGIEKVGKEGLKVRGKSWESSSVFSYILLYYLIWTASCNIEGVEN
jgi:hypothetical protein